MQHILGVFQESEIYKKLRQHFGSTDVSTDVTGRQHLGSTDVSAAVTGFEKLTEQYCPDVVSELRGVAEGAGVDYREVSFVQILFDR